jgi:hypothetical protein
LSGKEKVGISVQTTSEESGEETKTLDVPSSGGISGELPAELRKG